MSATDEAKRKVAEALKAIHDLDSIPGTAPADIDEWVMATRSFINSLGGCWEPEKMDYDFESHRPQSEIGLVEENEALKP